MPAPVQDVRRSYNYVLTELELAHRVETAIASIECISVTCSQCVHGLPALICPPSHSHAHIPSAKPHRVLTALLMVVKSKVRQAQTRRPSLPTLCASCVAARHVLHPPHKRPRRPPRTPAAVRTRTQSRQPYAALRVPTNPPPACLKGVTGISCALFTRTNSLPPGTTWADPRLQLSPMLTRAQEPKKSRVPSCLAPVWQLHKARQLHKAMTPYIACTVIPAQTLKPLQGHALPCAPERCVFPQTGQRIL